MNKYTLGILIKPVRFPLSRLESINIETDLELTPTEDFISEYPPNLIRVLETIGDRLGLKYDEKIVAYSVSEYIEPKFQKIVFGEMNKFRRPTVYDAYKINFEEYLIVAYGIKYVYNKNENILKKLDGKNASKISEDDFQKIDFDITTIPENVIYI